MKITIDFDGIQENKKYDFSFCLSSGGEVKVEKTTSKPRKTKEKQGPNLEDFEKGPQIDDFGEKSGHKEIRVESSFEGKIDPTV